MERVAAYLSWFDFFRMVTGVLQARQLRRWPPAANGRVADSAKGDGLTDERK